MRGLQGPQIAWPVSRKHETLAQCWGNAGPVSKTMGQHYPRIGRMSRVCVCLTLHVFKECPVTFTRDDIVGFTLTVVIDFRWKIFSVNSQPIVMKFYKDYFSMKFSSDFPDLH